MSGWKQIMFDKPIPASPGWIYYTPRGMRIVERGPDLMAAHPVTETVGATQLDVLLRMRRARSGMLVLTHTRDAQANRERMALRRLVERKLVSAPTYVRHAPLRNWRGHALGPSPRSFDAQHVYTYTLTERGRTCWLRTRERA